MTARRARRDKLHRSLGLLRKHVRLLTLAVIGSWCAIAATIRWVPAAAAPPPCWTAARGQVGQWPSSHQGRCQRLRGMSAVPLQALQNADDGGVWAVEVRNVTAELRKAEAFKLPTVEALRQEVAALEAEEQQQQQQHIQQQHTVEEQLLHEQDPQSGQQPGSGFDPLHEVEPQSEQQADSGFDRVMRMSREERLQLAIEYGPAFLVSLAMVALCYWMLSFPFMAYAYHEATGEWPQLDQLGIEFYSDRTRGTATTVVANAIGIAILLKPMRFLIALTITPWIKDNVLPLMGAGSDNDGSNTGRRH